MGTENHIKGGVITISKLKCYVQNYIIQFCPIYVYKGFEPSAQLLQAKQSLFVVSTHSITANDKIGTIW